MDPLSMLYHRLDTNLEPAHVDKLKMLLHRYVDKKDLPTLSNAHKLFLYLTERGTISQDNLGLLHDAFEEMALPGLVREIDVFSQQQDPCNYPSCDRGAQSAKTYKKLLIEHYKEKLEQFELIPWYEGGYFVNLVDVYTKLELVEKQSRGKESKGADFRKVFDRDNIKKRVFVEGEPGIGKSTLCRKLALDWAEGTEPMLKKYELLILLELRQMVDEGGVIDAMFDQLLPFEPNVDKHQLKHYICQNPEKIVFVLDGADELKPSLKNELKKIMAGKMFPKSIIILSSRSTERGRFIQSPLQHFIIKGFSTENAIAYVKRYFADTEEDIEIDELLHGIYRNDGNLASLTVNPLNTVLLCALWEDKQGKLPSKLSELYESIILSIVNRFLKKMGLSAVYEIASSEYRERLQKLGRMAYDALLKNQVRFHSRDIQSVDICEDDEVLRIGLLNREYSSAKLTPNKCWVFTHKTFQEYMAAFYLFSCEKISKTNVLDKIVDSVELGTLCLFIAGMLDRDAAPLFDILKQRLASGVQPFYHYMTLGLSCLYETGHPRMFVDIISDEIVRSKIVAFDQSAFISKACYEGLTELIRHCNEVSAAETSSRPQLIELDLAYNFVSHKLLDVLCDSKDLETLLINVLVSEDKNPLTNLALMPVKHLLLRFACQNVTDDFVLDMSNSVHLKQLFIGIYNVNEFSSIAEYSHENANLTSKLYLNDNLEYLSLDGQFRAEEMFCRVGKQISRHQSLKGLSSTFSSNGLLAERRQVMAEILEQSLTLTTWHINTEVVRDWDNQYSDCRKTSPISECIFEKDLSDERKIEVNEANQIFYRAIKENKVIKFMTIDHWGEDPDLLSICNSIKHNAALHCVLIYLSKLTPSMETKIFEMLSENKSISLFAIVSELSIDNKSLDDYELINLETSKISYPAGMTRNKELLYLLRTLYRYVSTLDTGSSTFDKNVRKKLLQEILPALKDAGNYVTVWERKIGPKAKASKSANTTKCDGNSQMHICARRKNLGTDCMAVTTRTYNVTHESYIPKNETQGQPVMRSDELHN